MSQTRTPALTVTTASVTDSASPTGSSPRPSRGRGSGLTTVVRRLAAVALVSVLAATGMLVTAQPASAATSVSYCFKDVYGAPFALRDTRVEVWNGYGWLTVAQDRTGTTGCSSVNTYTWRNYHVRVSAGSFTQNFVGSTPLYANPGTYSGVHLGTGYVYLRR